MKKIPPEHPAAKSLEHAFRSLGEERAREQHRRRGTGRVARLALAVLAPLLAIAAVATGAKVFTGDGNKVRPDPRGIRDPRGQRDLTASGRPLAAAASDDPRGGLRWGMRVYTSASDRTCVTVGQVRRGRLGFQKRGGFRELPPGSPGLCGRFREQHVVVGRRTWAEGYNVLYGVVDRTVRRLHIMRPSNGKSAEVPIAPDGTFLLVRLGRRAFFHELLVVDGTGGRSSLPLDPT